MADGTTATVTYPYATCGANVYGAGLSRQIAESASDVVQATQAQNLAALNAINATATATQAIAVESRSDINRVNGDIRLSLSETESRVSSAVERNGGDTRLAQSESESRLGGAVERNGGDTRMSVERNGGDIRTMVSSNSAELRAGILAVQNVLSSEMNASAVELRSRIADYSAAALLEIERSKHETMHSRASIERQAAENTCKLALEAERNKFELAKQMAECCCHTKEAIHAEGERTRTLIEKNEIDRLREALEMARRDGDHYRSNEAVRVNIENVLRNNSPNNNFRSAA